MAAMDLDPPAHRAPTLLTIPAEIRLQIYGYLLLPETDPVSAPLPTSSSTSTSTANIISIRTYETERYSRLSPHIRSRYFVMGGRFRASTLPTTYHLISTPNLHPSILRVSRLLHDEASHYLYSRSTFDFGRDVEAVVPFLSDLTPQSRRSIRHVNLIKRALPYTKDFDACEWRDVCAYLASECEIVSLGLRVFGGKVPQTQLPRTASVGLPGLPPPVTAENTSIGTRDEGRCGVAFGKNDFGYISRFEGMEWVRQLLAIKGLRRVDVGAIWEACPPPCSNALAFFVRFSESIEGGFAEFLRENMVAGAA